MPGKPLQRQSLKILNALDPEDVVEWHHEGESIASIQRRLGVTRDGWYKWVRTHPGLLERLREARELRAADLPWEGLEMIDNAEPSEIPKVREQVRARQWIAERLATQFKPKQEVSGTINVVDQFFEALKASQNDKREVMEAEIVEGDIRELPAGDDTI